MWFWALIQSVLLILIIRKINIYLIEQQERLSYINTSKFLLQFKVTTHLDLKNWIYLDKIHIKKKRVEETVSIVSGKLQKTLTANGYIKQSTESKSGDLLESLADCVITITYTEDASIDPEFCGLVTKTKAFQNDREYIKVFLDVSREAYDEIDRLLSSNSLTASIETRYDLVSKMAKGDNAAPTAFRILSIGALIPEVSETFLGIDFNNE